jgi:hypothetical protein
MSVGPRVFSTWEGVRRAGQLRGEGREGGKAEGRGKKGEVPEGRKGE